MQGSAPAVIRMLDHDRRILYMMLVCAYVDRGVWTPVLMLEVGPRPDPSTHLIYVIFKTNGSESLGCFLQTELHLDAKDVMEWLLAHAQWHALPDAMTRAMADR